MPELRFRSRSHVTAQYYVPLAWSRLGTGQASVWKITFFTDFARNIVAAKMSKAQYCACSVFRLVYGSSCNLFACLIAFALSCNLIDE